METPERTLAGCIALVLIVPCLLIGGYLYRAHQRDLAIRPHLGMIGQPLPAVTQDPATFHARQAWEARHGKPETLPGTSPQLWRIYLPKTNITLAVDKTTSRVTSVRHGRR
jgi:hypothetical protein